MLVMVLDINGKKQFLRTEDIRAVCPHGEGENACSEITMVSDGKYLGFVSKEDPETIVLRIRKEQAEHGKD